MSTKKPEKKLYRAYTKDFTQEEIEQVILSLTPEQKDELDIFMYGEREQIEANERIRNFDSYYPEFVNFSREYGDEKMMEEYYCIYLSLLEKIKHQTGTEEENQMVMPSEGFYHYLDEQLRKRDELKEFKTILNNKKERAKETLIQPIHRLIIVAIFFSLHMSMIFVVPIFAPWVVEAVWYYFLFFWLRTFEYGFLLHPKINWKDPKFWLKKILINTLMTPIGAVITLFWNWKILLVILITLRVAGVEGNLAASIILIIYMITIQIYSYVATTRNYKSEFNGFANAEDYLDPTTGEDQGFRDTQCQLDVVPTPVNFLDNPAFKNKFFASKPVRIFGDFLRWIGRKIVHLVT